jgi:dihydropteroate synthase
VNVDAFLSWLRLRALQPTKPLIMGIVNVTPDSFSDGGQFLAPQKACEHALQMVEEGADLIDIGGESTRPGAKALPVDIEVARVIPVIEAIRRHSSVCISIDSYKPEVMQAAVSCGANWINDVYALRHKGALEMASTLKVPVCLMHMQGEPETMQSNPNYPLGLFETLDQFFSKRIAAAQDVGLRLDQLLIDPGFGFGKSSQHNLQIVHKLSHFHTFGLPIVLGLSRKKTLGLILGEETNKETAYPPSNPRGLTAGIREDAGEILEDKSELLPNERLMASVALTVYAQLQGVGIIRTHDVKAINQALLTIQALYKEVA